MSLVRYLNRSELPPVLERVVGGYKGNSFKLESTSTLILHNYWSGGSRSTYIAVELATGKMTTPALETTRPTSRAAHVSFELPKGICVLERIMFRGKDMGYSIHVRPDDLAPLLPPPEDALPIEQRVVLAYTCHYKNSYSGESNLRFKNAYRETGISEKAWEVAKAALIESRHLRKNGAVTVEGRNAIGNERFGPGSLDLGKTEETAT